MNDKAINITLIVGLAVLLALILILGLCIYAEVEDSIIYLNLTVLLLATGAYFFLTKHLITKKISKKVSEILLEAPFEFIDRQKTITTDMDALSREVKKFTQDKMQEIEILHNRENYRKEFMGNISHELKTPLFTVQGYILTLIDGAKNDAEVLDRYLTGAAKGVERLVRVVEDMDLISELESGNLVVEKENFDVVALIKSVLDLLQIKTHKKKITLILDRAYSEEVPVHADKQKIEQVLINIIENSIKYGKKNGTTEVTIEPLSKSKYIIRITDNGEGMSEENISRIFERFYRIDKSGSRKEGGSGLGLSIVKHIIEAHNERIYVESQPGVGSEFSFTLERGNAVSVVKNFE
ncbi:MAG TPA: ATP-binding protein [Flavobacteriaceae bacterium]|nr:ATP-binding protein [Flavobacteriaceae bacterium]